MEDPEGPACLHVVAGGGSTDVHMGNTNFTQSSVTISKGSSLNLIDDVNGTHVISNGFWVN